MKQLLTFLVLMCGAVLCGAQTTSTTAGTQDSLNAQSLREPDFILDGIINQGGEETCFTAYPANIEKYNDWGHVQEHAVRIKEKGNKGNYPVKANLPFDVIIRTGNNSVTPSNVFSVLQFKVKGKDRRIDFIGFFRVQSSHSSSTSSSKAYKDSKRGFSSGTTTYTNLPDYEDRFPSSIVRITGKKLGEESYILNVPALSEGEYAICFKDGNGELMLVDISVK